jgi:hypothetical protein
MIAGDGDPAAMAAPPHPIRLAADRRQSPAACAISRGVARLLKSHAMAAVSEVALANGRRADIVGLSDNGSIWIVEIKSSLQDFRADQKWPEYRDFCDRFFFAVLPDFPREVLPAQTGLIIADHHGGDIVAHAPEHKIPSWRRQRMTLQVARTAALRLQAAMDPVGFPLPPYL